MLPILLQLAGKGRLDRAIHRLLEQKEHLRRKKKHKKETQKKGECRQRSHYQKKSNETINIQQRKN